MKRNVCLFILFQKTMTDIDENGDAFPLLIRMKKNAVSIDRRFA